MPLRVLSSKLMEILCHRPPYAAGNIELYPLRPSHCISEGFVSMNLHYYSDNVEKRNQGLRYLENRQTLPVFHAQTVEKTV